MILEFVRSMGPEERQKTKDAWAEIHALDALIKRPPEIKSREELIEKIKDFNDMHERIKKINALKPALFSKKFFYKLSRSMDNLANFDKEERASAIEDKFKRPLESQKRATRYLGEYFHLNATVLHRDIVRHDLRMTALAKEAGIKRELFDKFDSLLSSLKEVETKYN